MRNAGRALHLAGWNALLLAAGLSLIGLAGEAWLRSTMPFVADHAPMVFVPDVGMLRRPRTEIRWTNHLDYWTISHTNSLGFVDREPPSPERTAESCHVAMLGDSFVEAKEVSIADKFHVRLEDMTARELPHLDVTTSAFGMGGTGQINQLAFYDKYVRHLHPRLVVLVFVPNDYVDNFPLWRALRTGLDPDHLPHVSAARAEDGSFRLRPPDPEHRRFMMLVRRLLGTSGILSWFRERIRGFYPDYHVEKMPRNLVRASQLDGWRPEQRRNEDAPSFFALFQEGRDSPFYKEALAFTAFALDEFKERAQRDGAALVILATYRMSYFGGGVLARLEELAAERGIPVIDQGGFIRRQGAGLRDARWAHDLHWNPTGHQWAAQALLEYLEQNQDICE